MEKSKKIKSVVELKVLDDMEDSGVSAIALVDEPAIEKYWVYMRKHKFVEPGKGESQSDFMGRCVPAMIDEGKPQDQAVAMCISMYEQKHSKQKFADYPWDECQADMAERGFNQEEADNLCGWIRANMEAIRMGLDVGSLPPYIEQTPSKKKGKFEKDKFIEPNPCWEGYEAYGTKIVDGKEVPNCIPVESKKSKLVKEKRFTKLRKEEKKSFFSSQKDRFALEKDQQILVGPAMIPDLEILRKDDNSNNYYVKFSEDTIQRIQEKFMRELRIGATNLDHNENNPAGAYLFESWIVENPKTDKANTVYKLDVPKGTWMVKMKITNQEVWKAIKMGKYRGFSIEGNFIDKEDYDKIQSEKEMIESIMRILNQ